MRVNTLHRRHSSTHCWVQSKKEAVVSVLDITLVLPDLYSTSLQGTFVNVLLSKPLSWLLGGLHDVGFCLVALVSKVPVVVTFETTMIWVSDIADTYA